MNTPTPTPKTIKAIVVSKANKTQIVNAAKKFVADYELETWNQDINAAFFSSVLLKLADNHDARLVVLKVASNASAFKQQLVADGILEATTTTPESRELAEFTL